MCVCVCDDHYRTDVVIDLYPLCTQVMSHELCHIFGLKHCYYFSCAMNESTSITEAATQPLFLCPICLRKMQKAVGFNVLERYKQLLQIVKQLHSALLEASTSVKDNREDDHIETEVTIQVDTEHFNKSRKTDTESETPVENEQEDAEGTSDRIVRDASQGDTRPVNEDHSGCHSEQFEAAIVWLEKAVLSLGQFEDQWVEQRAGHHTKNKIV